jgi:uncharacterized protein YecT (DUF1311 family)
MSPCHLLFSILLVFSAIQPAVHGQTASIAAETNKSIKKQEAEITALCGKIKKAMRPAEWAQFEKAQRAWTVFRDLEVGFYEKYLMRFNGSQNMALFVRDELAGARIKQLQELLESWNG